MTDSEKSRYRFGWSLEIQVFSDKNSPIKFKVSEEVLGSNFVDDEFDNKLSVKYIVVLKEKKKFHFLTKEQEFAEIFL